MDCPHNRLLPVLCQIKSAVGYLQTVPVKTLLFLSIYGTLRVLGF